MTPAQLRAAFLQAAIRGELVPQDRADGTATDLLAILRAERKRLEKQKKLRKQTTLPPLTPDEIPFPIPPSWQWVRLQEVAYMVGRRENQLLAKEVQATGKYPVISQGANFIDGYSNVEGKCVTDLPVVLFGDHTRNVKYLDFPFIIGADGVKLLKPFVINERYLYYWVLTTAQGLHNRGYARHFALLSKQLVPLPPLAEQGRIVSKLEDCLALCEAYEARERLDADFGVAMRKSILQAAIQGKLVPQDRADGTAADLLATLRAERKRLEKQKKLRKHAPLPPFTPAEIPFPIPPSWQWVRLQEVAYMVGRRENQLLAKEVQATGKYPVISQGANFIDGYSNVEGKCVTDLPVVLFGDHTRNVKYLDFPFIIGADGVKLLKPFVINERYLYYWVLTTAQGLHNRGYARHFALLSKQLVPLPPLAEQGRIVSKLGELLPLCAPRG